MAAIHPATWALLAAFSLYMFVLLCMVSLSDAVRTYVLMVRGWGAAFQVLWLACFAALLTLSVQCATKGGECKRIVAVVTGLAILQVLANIAAMFVVHVNYNDRVPHPKPPVDDRCPK